MFPFIWDGLGVFVIGAAIGIAGVVGAILAKSNLARAGIAVVALVFAVPLVAQSHSIVDQAKKDRGADVTTYLSKNYSLKLESNEDAYKLTGGEPVTAVDKNGKTLKVSMLHSESAHPTLQVQDIKILQPNR